jgi:hypothetical protein
LGNRPSLPPHGRHLYALNLHIVSSGNTSGLTKSLLEILTISQKNPEMQKKAENKELEKARRK